MNISAPQKNSNFIVEIIPPNCLKHASDIVEVIPFLTHSVNMGSMLFQNDELKITPIDIKIFLDESQLLPSFFREWMVQRTKNRHEVGTLIVNVLDRKADNKTKYIFTDVYPVSVNIDPLSWTDTSEITNIYVQFKAKNLLIV